MITIIRSIFAAGMMLVLSLAITAKIDTTYTPAASNDVGSSAVSVIAVQNDGKVIVAGNFKNLNGMLKPTIGRLNTDGSLDGSFTVGTGFSESGNVPTFLKIAIAPDGKVLVLGSFTDYNGSSRPRLARLNADGTLDTAFSPTIDANVKKIGVQSDSKVLLFGGSMTVNGVARTGVGRLNVDGTIDAAFNPSIGNPDIKDAVIEPDGKITIVGSFTSVNGVSRTSFARLNADGTTDSTAVSFFTQLDVIARQPDGKYVVARPPTMKPPGSDVYRLNIDGTQDNSLRISPPVGVDAIAVDAAGNIVISWGPNSTLAYNPYGAFINVVPGGSNSSVRALAVSGKKIYAVGGFSTFAGVARSNIARFVVRSSPFDFDGDGRADVSVTRPADYNWYQLLGVNYNFTGIHFGQPGDFVTPGDFDGDDKTDVAIFHPASGDWWYQGSSDNVTHFIHWGVNGDLPMPGDFNGDGRTDVAVVRNFNWIVSDGTGNILFTANFGQAGDRPLTGDFDGDGKADIAVYRPSTGEWRYSGSRTGLNVIHWGLSTDTAVPADYDGDGKTDLAVYRASEGNWYILGSSIGFTATHFGIAEDKPIAADYDGDGKADIAVYRPSQGFWYLLLTTGGYTGFPFGIASDIPTPNAYIVPGDPPRAAITSITGKQAVKRR